MPTDLTTATVESLPACDIHGDHPAAYDARTRTGQWGFLCEAAFREHGVGLGTGKGQRLRLRDDHHLASLTAACAACGVWPDGLDEESNALVSWLDVDEPWASGITTVEWTASVPTESAL